MEFEFSDEHEMIRTSAEGFLADISNSAAVCVAIASERERRPPSCDLPFIPPKQSRKLELSSVELAILLEQKGCLFTDKQFLSMPGEHLAY